MAALLADSAAAEALRCRAGELAEENGLLKDEVARMAESASRVTEAAEVRNMIIKEGSWMVLD
jgi:hypothetical protein